MKAGDKPVLRGIDLSVGEGEVHAIMGPERFRQSTPAILAGRESYG